MKITKLKIENFLTIGLIEANLSGKGLVLVQGENEDDTSQNSNGSGKSSFPDALSWCLYGVTARGETGDDVINNTAGKGTRVTVDLDDEGTIYRVMRHRKHPEGKNALKVCKLQEDGEVVDLTKGTDRLTQPVVDKIIGSSVDVFNAAIYAAQDKMPDLPGMTDKFLKQLVEEAAGIDRLQSAHAVAKTRLTEAQRGLDTVTGKRDALEKAIVNLKESLTHMEERKKSWESARDGVIKSLMTDLRARKAKFDADKAAYDPVVHTEVQGKLEAAKRQLSEVGAERTKEAKLTGVSEKAARDEVLTEAEYKRELVALKKLQGQLKNAGDKVGTPCDSCGKPYCEEDLADVRKILQLKFDSQKNKCLDLKSDAETKREATASALSALESYKASMTDTSAQVELIEALQSRETALQTQARQLDASESAMKVVAVALKERKAEENPHETSIIKFQSDLDTAEEKLVAIYADIVDAEKSVKLREEAVRVFGPGGVRAYVLDTVTPFLNARTSDYLSTLSDGNISAVWNTLSMTKKGELREKFSIDVSSLVGAKKFGGLSGGEKRKTRLACAMALQDLVASRAGKPIELWIADEIDDALDSSGLERLMSILDEKARDKGTVLTISHHSLSDWIREVVTIKKSGGYSTLIGDGLK